MAFKYAEAYVELAWKKDQYDAGEQQVQASIRTIGQQTADMAAKVQAATKSTSADVYELKDGFYKLSETVADVPKPLAQVEQRTLATGAAMKNLGGVVGLLSPQMGGLISIAGALQARLDVLSQAQGVNVTAVSRLGTAFSTLSTTVLAFMGTPVGLMITGFTAVVGLLASARKEGESLGDTLLRLTDIVHGLASAQEQLNRETERGNEIAKMNMDREERKRREKSERTPEGQAIQAVQDDAAEVDRKIAELAKRKAAAEKELEFRATHNVDNRSTTGMTKDEQEFSANWMGFGSIKNVSADTLEQEAKSLELDIQKLRNDKKRIESELPALEQDKKVADTKRFFGLDPNKSGDQIKRESEEKVRQRETQERLEQEKGRQRRAEQAAEADREAEERRKQRDEERARKEQEAARKAEQEAARKAEQDAERNKRARGALREMGLDQGERADFGMAAAFGGVGDIIASLRRGANVEAPGEPAAARQKFGFTGVADLASQIQQGMAGREEKEIAKKQAADISDIAEGKKAIKVELVKAIQMGAIFGP